MSYELLDPDEYKPSPKMPAEKAKQQYRYFNVGDRFGRLVILCHGGRIAIVACDCGTVKQVNKYALRSGNTRGCGCIQREGAGARFRVHGGSKTPTHTSWRAMMSRCYAVNNDRYKSYGALGVAVCERWRHSFSAFLEDMGERPKGMTLDRIDVNGNYEPGNCKWATALEQARNKRRRITWVANGVSYASLREAVIGSRIGETKLRKLCLEGKGGYSRIDHRTAKASATDQITLQQQPQ